MLCALRGRHALRVLVFYGVGGIGKTALVQKLTSELGDAKPPVPHALFSMEKIGDQTRAYREVLFRWPSYLDSQFGVSFPRFDPCLGVMLAREGGDPPHLVRLNPSIRGWHDLETETEASFTNSSIQAEERHVGHRRSGCEGAGEVDGLERPDRPTRKRPRCTLQNLLTKRHPVPVRTGLRQDAPAIDQRPLGDLLERSRPDERPCALHEREC